MFQSLDRALSMLEYLSVKKSAGVSELAEAFQVDKSTATRVMQTFAAHDIVTRDEYTLKYRLSSGTLRLSWQVRLNNRITEVARPVLSELARLTEETARLCGFGGRQIHILDQVSYEAAPALRGADIPGVSKPVYCSAVGKTMLAYLTEAEVRELLGGMELRRFTENTVTDPDALLEGLRQVRQQGYALNLAEYTDRAFCIAVPVFDENGVPTYSLGISGKTDFRQYPARFGQIIGCLKDAGAMLTREYREFLRKNP